LSITWKRKDGSGAEANLAAGESVAANVLTINVNALGTSASKLLTYIAYVTYNDPDTGLPINAMTDISFALVQTGANAKSCWVSGEQVFKYGADNEVAPGQITLTANLQHVTVSKWLYRAEGGAWQEYPTTADNASISGTTLVVKPTHSVFVGDMATIKVTTDDANISDVMTIYKVRDGMDGTIGSSAPMAFLSNETIQFIGNAAGQVSSTTKTCNVIAYHGTSKVTPTVGTVTGAPTGMTVEVQAAVNNEVPIKITIANNATLGGAGQQQGVLTIPVTSPVNTSYQLHWSKVNSGAQGTAGESAVVFSLFAPEGTVFINHEGSLPVKVSAYHGSTIITSGATYAWSKYQSGSWNPLPETGATLTVDGTDVPGTASYRCQMTYDGKTYQDVITLTDKSDNYQATIDSTGGSIFKNTIGQTVLICRLWANGAETDVLRSSVFSQTAPASPVSGAFYYKTSNSSPQMPLMRWNGTTWVDVTDSAEHKHTQIYKWYRRNKDGNPMDGGSAFATGKTIFVTGDDVDSKTVFTCEVE